MPDLPNLTPLTRREFLRDGCACIATASCIPLLTGSAEAAPANAEPVLRLGLVTDVHYADKDTAGTRFYRESLPKMEEAVDVFNRSNLHAVVELGDWIDGGDGDEKNLDRVNSVFSQVRARRLFVPGNHCVAHLSKQRFFDKCRQSRSFLSTDVNGIHLVILDACYRKDGVSYDRGPFDWKDTDIPEWEREWLREDLARTPSPALVFVHQRLDLPSDNVHNVHSAPSVREILESSGKVLAVFQGHTHTNDLISIKGIPYITLSAMVDGSGPLTGGYSILNLYPTRRMELIGFRQHLRKRTLGG